MSDSQDFSEAKIYQDKEKACAAFNRLLHKNKLTKEQAEELRASASCTEVRALASQFLGRCTPATESFLGCCFALIVVGALLYGVISFFQNLGKDTSYSEKLAAQEQQRQSQSALEKLVNDMKRARKIGLTNGRVLQEEKNSPDYSLNIEMQKAYALSRNLRYSGTVQFAEVASTEHAGTIHFVSSSGTNVNQTHDFSIFTKASVALLDLHVTGHSTAHNTKTFEYYGTWRSEVLEGMSGYFTARQHGTMLQVQIFRTENGTICYVGRALLSATK